MKPLPAEFVFDYCKFRQLAREGDVVLLERTRVGHHRSSYEVVIIQHHPAGVIHGRHYIARESMPPTASWGCRGWSYDDLPSAKARFDELVTSRVMPRFTPTPFPASALEAVGRISTNTTTATARQEKGNAC